MICLSGVLSNDRPCATIGLLFLIRTASVAICLSPLTSCDGSKHSADSETAKTSNVFEVDAQSGPPSDQTVHYAAWTMNESYLTKTFKRGQVLEALGGGSVPVGTALYPIKLEEFPYPIYLSRDEFGEWRFNIGDRSTLYAVRTPPPPETTEAREEREAAEKVEALAQAQRMANSKRWQEEENAKEQRRKAEKKNAENAAQNNKDAAAQARLDADNERRRLDAIEIEEHNRRSEEEAKEQRLRQDDAIKQEMAKTAAEMAEAEKVSQEEIRARDSKIREEGQNAKGPNDQRGLKNSDKVSTELILNKEKLRDINEKIAAERKRWLEANEVINRLTNFKKTPVREGSAAYQQCMNASQIIHDVELTAPSLKAEKSRLESLIGN